jgi:hypothetical protein
MENKHLRLIKEYTDFSNFEVLTESSDVTGKSIMHISGPFLCAELRNKNKRMYPLPVLQNSVKRYTEEKINKRASLGELGHPDGITINLDRASHLIEEIVWKDNYGIGKAEILDNQPCGKIAYGLLERKILIGISTRGLGEIAEVSEGVNVKDYHMVTADLVADPSAPGAFVEGILESKEFVLESSGNIIEVELAYDELERKLSTLPKRSRNRLFTEAWKTFMSKLR